MTETNNLSVQSTPYLLRQLCALAAQKHSAAFILYDILSYRFAKIEADGRCVAVLNSMARDDDAVAQALIDAWGVVTKQTMEGLNKDD